MVKAKDIGSAALLMYGGHVIRQGCSLYMIELMKRGLITHLATNGSGEFMTLSSPNRWEPESNHDMSVRAVWIMEGNRTNQWYP